MITSPITPHAARAATEIAQQCGLFEHETPCVEQAVQRGIDAALSEARAEWEKEMTAHADNV